MPSSNQITTTNNKTTPKFLQAGCLSCQPTLSEHWKEIGMDARKVIYCDYISVQILRSRNSHIHLQAICYDGCLCLPSAFILTLFWMCGLIIIIIVIIIICVFSLETVWFVVFLLFPHSLSQLCWFGCHCHCK